ncbi:hypothetical protein [Nocardiopsis halotolerans]|uniref:hypothetical protein n=1 Tax=Nocardiopsis halotolerans TaxID=124252 RepID=UPI001F4D252B|nr:hypothetical protein [Nocardiopsis halotolerans]
MVVSASRYALDGWAAAPGSPDVPDLVARYRGAFDALPGGLTVSAPARHRPCSDATTERAARQRRAEGNGTL